MESHYTLRAIDDSNMIFISAQPDHTYFHWQVELYLYQFSKLGIAHRCYAVFGYNNDNPSQELVSLAKKFKNIYWYKDERDNTTKNFYIPSIRPHILKKFFTIFPSLGKNVFYHDSDIFLVKLPRFELMLSDDTNTNVGYVSDTLSYIGYEYLRSCSQKYKNTYPDLPDNDIISKMCQCIGIPEYLVYTNNTGAGGAQYLLKNVTSSYWDNVEKSCTELYSMLKDYEQTYPINDPIQSWTADMWAVLWNYWKLGYKTKIHPELDFSWATGTSDDYLSKNIFHCAGVTNDTSTDKFYKANYINSNVFAAYENDKTIFDHISPNSATYGYICIIKEYVDSGLHHTTPRTEQQELPDDEIHNRFTIMFGNKSWDGIYTRDPNKSYFGKPLWRCGNYIIFYNSQAWILTDAIYEDQISETCGGFCSCYADEPYINKWNIPCHITFT